MVADGLLLLYHQSISRSGSAAEILIDLELGVSYAQEQKK